MTFVRDQWPWCFCRPLVHDGERDLNLESPFNPRGIRHDESILRATDLALRDA